MSGKIIVCRCEDVTLKDVEHTFALGYVTVEEVKRYTGLGTGPCQGKECMAQTALLCARHTTHVEPFTARPPVAPVPFSVLAAAADDE